MIWKTKITQMCGIEYPIIMGAFGGWGKSDFAHSFSEAGGLGMITALNFPTFEDFRKDLQKMKALTDKPFAINLSLPHRALDKDFEIESTQERYLKYIDIAFSEGCRIFTTSGYKSSFIEKRVHESGGYWIHKCTLLNHALSAESEGADAVTILGLEGTGFKNPNSNTTLVNITVMKKHLNIPMVAAGGIGDARGLLGALAMGADGVCLGTALMTTTECPVPLRVKQKWLQTDIFSEDFHKRIYLYNKKNFMAPSTAIAHNKEVIPMKKFLNDMISNAENILKSWGFNNNEFNSMDS
jgi:NAD(P)H-dependent flavin oxidoreductase YrpB (nitropropane dioxygenase family)